MTVSFLTVFLALAVVSGMASAYLQSLGSPYAPRPLDYVRGAR